MDPSIRPLNRTDIVADAELAARFVAAGGKKPVPAFEGDELAIWEASFARWLAEHVDGGEASA